LHCYTHFVLLYFLA